MKFRVTLPITGSATAYVEAKTREEALRTALSEGNFDLDEWDVHSSGCRGNVCNQTGHVDIREEK